MSYLPNKNKKITIHLIFLFILSLYYLIPYFLVGELILKSTDLLDSGVVYNHIIGRIYRGDFESLNLFIAGEFKWYFLQRTNGSGDSRDHGIQKKGMEIPHSKKFRRIYSKIRL